MTALYAILAVVLIGGMLMGAYLVGFDDGVKAEQMRRSIYVESCTVTLDEDKHRLTHADLVQMEQEARNKTKGPLKIDRWAENMGVSVSWMVDWLTANGVAAEPSNDGIEASYAEPFYKLTETQFRKLIEDAKNDKETNTIGN